MTKPIFNGGAGLEIENYSDSPTTLYTQMLNGYNDPTVAPGVSAPISSQYTRSVDNGDGTFTITVYDKIGAADTAWVARANNSQIQQLNSLGAPDDGTYTDGLFQWSSNTKIANAADNINEFLALMAPPPAPNLSNIAGSSAGATGKLSFDSTHTITGYFYDANTINTTVQNSGTDLGIFNGSTAISGVLNNNVVASSSNSYPAKAFGNGTDGTLELVVNGVVVHTSPALSSFVSGMTGTGSYFTLSAAAACQFSNGNQFPTLQYRTGSFTIGVAAQRPGYNYVQVNHVTSSGTYTTNTFYWYNSVNTTAITATTPTLTASMAGSKYLSGVQYYTSGSMNLTATVNNAYADVYSASAAAVSPTSTYGAFTAVALPNTTSNTATYALNATATVSSAIRLLGTSPTASFTVLHPVKTTYNSGAVSGGSMLYDPINTGTVLVEDFNTETYRTSSVPASASTTPTAYNSQTSLATNNDLQFYNSRLQYPTGNYKAVADGGSIQYAPANNPSYVGLTGTRTVIRAFQNNTGLTKANFTLLFAGATTTFSPVGTLTGNNLSVEVKFPQGSLAAGTGWMDAYQDFATGNWADGAGCRAGSFGNGRALATTWGITVGTQSIAANEWVYVRITAPASWTGYLDSITLAWL